VIPAKEGGAHSDNKECAPLTLKANIATEAGLQTLELSGPVVAAPVVFALESARVLEILSLFRALAGTR